MALIKLADDKIYELIKERKEWNETYIKLAKKYHASVTNVAQLIQMYDNGTLEDFLKKRRIRISDQGGIKKVLEYEEIYNPISYNAKINNFFSKNLKIADNIELSEEDAISEINKLLIFITTDIFEKEFGRSFDLIDMYLTTNLTAKGICIDYQEYMDGYTSGKINNFLHDELQKVDNNDLFQTYCFSKLNTYRRFTRPVKNRIEKMLNLDFFLFNSVNASMKDVDMAHQILLDLNEKYGVKYDEISLYLILLSYLEGNIDSYYEVGDKYKEELDQKTHVQKRCIPILTRRENNK